MSRKAVEQMDGWLKSYLQTFDFEYIQFWSFHYSKSSLL